MLIKIKSFLIWTAIGFLILFWVPLLGLVRMFDRDPARYRTGRMFRLLGKWMTMVNPEWKITITGEKEIDDRNPYVVVSNHLSNADIPLISNLPWEMKWMAKQELFGVPLVGWMMKMAGDIPVHRRNPNKQLSTFKLATHYLQNDCSVMVFPEGTRSRSGNLGRFTSGAFFLAVREQVPILPLVIDGTQNCLPKRSWTFGHARNIRLKVLEPVSTDGLGKNDVDKLMDEVRDRILDQLAEWREEDKTAVDTLAGSTTAAETDKQAN